MIMIIININTTTISGGSMGGGGRRGERPPQEGKEVRISSSYSAIKVRYLVNYVKTEQFSLEI